MQVPEDAMVVMTKNGGIFHTPNGVHLTDAINPTHYAFVVDMEPHGHVCMVVPEPEIVGYGVR